MSQPGPQIRVVNYSFVVIVSCAFKLLIVGYSFFCSIYYVRFAFEDILGLL